MSWTLVVAEGDIVAQDADAIVLDLPGPKLTDFCDESLPGRVHAAAGNKLVGECMSLKNLDVGRSRMTAGYDLPARYVIHTLSPGPGDNNEFALRSCYFTAMTFAFLQGFESIAFPCLGRGKAKGWKPADAARIALFSINWFLTNHDTDIKTIRCVCYEEGDYLAYLQAFKEMRTTVLSDRLKVEFE